MSKKSDKNNEYISTGTIHVLLGINNGMNYSVDFSPDSNHTVTDKLKHKYAVFLETKTSTCDCKKPDSTSICDCKNSQVRSIVKPLKIGVVNLSLNNRNWKDEMWRMSLSDCAIKEAKVDVFVKQKKKKLKLIGFRMPAIQSLD